jgi:hypothetical protein
MKTSNKILLSALLAFLLIMVSVHAAIYAKYKKGDYTLITDNFLNLNFVSYSLEDVKVVSVNNVENLTVRNADTSNFRYEKPDANDENILQFTKNGDTLFVTGKSNKSSIGRWYRPAELLVNGSKPLQFINSQVHVVSNKRMAKLDISLNDAFLEFVSNDKRDLSLDDLNINAENKSTISLRSSSAQRFNLRLRNSFVEENEFKSDSIFIDTDPGSEIKLRGENLLKAKFSGNE